MEAQPVVTKEKKPRTEAQKKAFEATREKLKEKHEAKRFSRDQEAKQIEDQRQKVEDVAKTTLSDEVEVKVMEKKKPKAEPKPKKLEVVIPAEVERAVERASAPKPRAPKATVEVPQQYPVPPAPPAKPVYSNPYMEQIASRMRR
jgi:hypothetical protein